MAETTKMELVTPGRVVVSKPVEMVVIPVSYTHPPSPRDTERSRMPSSA